MKLLLPIPEDWRRRPRVEGILHSAPGKNLDLLVTPLTPVDSDPEGWIVWSISQLGTPRNLQPSWIKTETGWAALILDADLDTAKILVIYYFFLDYAAAVIVVCKHPEKRPSWRDEAMAILMQAKPDFRHEGVVSLAHELGAPAPVVATRPGDAGPVSGWKRTFSGGDVILTADDNPRLGRIEINRRVMPLEPASELTARFMLGAGTNPKVEGPGLMVTAEGEYAMVVNAIRDDRQITMGVIFGDDFFARISGTSMVPEQHPRFLSAVIKLTYAYTMGLGSNRWRRFYYEAPAGWAGIGRTRESLWISPRCPQQYQLMRVFDARPPSENKAARQGARLLETLPQEFFQLPRNGPVTFQTANGISCEVTVYTGTMPNRQGVIKAIEGTVIERGYIYPIRLECDEALLQETLFLFEKVVSSIRPFPERGPDLDPDLGVLTSWSD